MVLKLLAILPSGSAGKFLKKIWNFEKWGGTTTPPISAECQIGRQIIKKSILPRVRAVKSSATFRRHF
ncbi:hypothetical protein AOY33_14685 [Enterococcus durans]|nr:hypothetical protein AOY33_14685 [Enterococcus durans]